MTMKITKLSTNGSRWCEVAIELTDARLSITGTEGRIMKARAAAKEAIDYWESYFDDSPGERHKMGERFDRRFKNARAAARFVVATDGQYHGLDVHRTDGDHVYVVESCGQIRETIAEYFPEVMPLFAYHLNDMHAGCEHQDALGWGNGRDIALDVHSMTAEQRASLMEVETARAGRLRDKRIREVYAELAERQSKRRALFERIRPGKTLTLDADQALAALGREGQIYPGRFERELWTAARKQVQDDVAAEFPIALSAQIFKDSIGAPCPTCGYRYGTSWLKRALPAEVLALVAKLAEDWQPVTAGE
jgi:hypothetical protein